MGTKPVDETGNKYGRLTVKYQAKRNVKWRAVHWLCVCDCGKEIVASGVNLRRGLTTSCGCNRKEYPNEANTLNWFIKSLSYSASRRNIDITLTVPQIKELIQGDCYYCGGGLSGNRFINGETFRYNGIDRIDNNKGYHIDNVVPCCQYCNRAKWKMTTEEFRLWIIKLHNHFIDKT